MKNTKNYILDQLSKNLLTPEEATKMLTELKEKGKESSKIHDIAIIGAACKVPMANNKEDFWDNLINQRVCLVSKPEGTLKADEVYKNKYYAEFANTIQTTDTNYQLENYVGAFVEDIDKFDAAFFGIPPREAAYIEPSQRVFMEAAWSAIEDAGYCMNNIRNTKTGVYVGRDGAGVMNYRNLVGEDPMKLSGTWDGILASRLSYVCNLRGPAMVIDTACSAGLVAVNEACGAIRSGECDMAIAGGIAIGAAAGQRFGDAKDLGLEEDENENVLSQVRSDDCRVRTFDKKCSGTVFGEGVVTLLLKPLEAAERDHDNIYAVIKGSAINNDGASNGLTAPNPLAQEAVIVNAWKRANVDPETISYVESHGTATLLGDPIEIIGLTNAFEKFTDKKQFCGIGSVKTNFGHLVGASGTVNLLKVMMSMNHHEIPASLNFEEPNPHINFIDSPIYVVSENTKWEDKNHPLRAGISSFGFSGTNCHLILEEYKSKEEKKEKAKHRNIFTMSAKTETAMKKMIENYYNFYQAKSEECNMDNICFTSTTGRGHYKYRFAVLVEDYADFKRKLGIIRENGLKTIEEESIYYGKNHVVSDKRKEILEGEITESELNQITSQAQDCIQRNLKDEGMFSSAEDFQTMSKLYVKGADIDWSQVYNGENQKRVPLPTYPFDRTPYWGEIKVTKISEEDSDQSKSEHVLVKSCLVNSIKESIYLVKLNLKKDWVIQDHKIMGSNLVPGTCFAEMTKEAVRQCYHSDQVEIEELVFLSPLVVFLEDGDLETHIVLEKYEDYVDVSIATRHIDSNEQDIWQIHAKGKARIHNETPVNQQSLEEIVKDPEVEKLALSTFLQDNEMNHFGGRWQCIQNFYKIRENGEDIIVTEVKLSDDLLEDVDSFSLHPGMLDNALNMAVMQLYSGEDFFLPFSYKNFVIFDKFPAHFYSKVKCISVAKDSEVIRCQVQLCDVSGNMLGKIEETTLKKINKINSYVNSSFYGARWIEKTKEVNEIKKPAGNVLVFTDVNRVSEQFVKSIESDENQIYYVETGEQFLKKDETHYVVGADETDYEKLLDSIGEDSFTMAAHFSTLNFAKEESDSFEKEIENGLYSLLFLTRVFMRKIKGNVTFLLCTDNAHDVTGEETYIKPCNSSFLALAKITKDECPNYSYACLDIDKDTDIQIAFADALSLECFRVAYRKNKRYEEILTSVDLNVDEKYSFKIRKNGTYVITGGTGGLGLEAALYLSEYSEDCNICLIGRRDIPERSEWDKILEAGEDSRFCRVIEKIKAMEGNGSHVMVRSADVSDYEAMSKIIEEVKNSFGDIHGVLHCAGVAGDGFLFKKSLETFNQVVRPKVFGIYVLDSLIREQKLDFLIMYSSMQSIFGGVGQGDYTAANAFLDAYAPYLWKKGIPAQTINWPGWTETGMAVEYGIQNAKTIFKSLTTQVGINALNSILFNGMSNVVPGKIDYEFLAQIGQENLPIQLSDTLKKEMKRYGVKSSKSGKNFTKSAIAPEELLIIGKGEEYTETERTIAYMYAIVLNQKEIDIFESFNSMGGDSILAMTLLNVIESKYQFVVTISDIFTYSTVEELSALIDQKLGKKTVVSERVKEEDNDNKLMSLLDDLENGEASVDSILGSLAERR